MVIIEKQRILVTGGTGFAGRHAIKRLIIDGHFVCALVRERTKLLDALKNDYSNHLTIIEAQNPEQMQLSELKQLMETNNITSVLHIAGLVGEHGFPWEEYHQTNVVWTKNLALAFIAANVDHKKFIFTSSVGVYGTIPEKVPAQETTPYNPDGKYHRSKVQAEEALVELRSTQYLPLVILRPTIIYGAGDQGYLLKIFKLMKKKRFPLCTGNPKIHLLDVQLLADVYDRLLSSDIMPEKYVFNVADPQPVCEKELADYIAKNADAGYRKVPSFVFSLLSALMSIRHQYQISIKLISKSWYYNVDELYQTLNLKAPDTINSLDKNYIDWYKGAAHIGG